MGLQITPAIFAVPSGRTIFVDGTNGNDARGLIGRVDSPFLTIAAAIAAASASSPTSSSPIAIRVGPGTFAQPTPQSGGFLQLPANVSLIGAGIGETIITGTGSLGNVLLVPGTGSIIENITAQSTNTNAAPIGCGSADTAFSSAIVRNSKFIGQSDCVYLNNASATNLAMYHCIIQSTFDTIFCNGGTHEFFDCDVSTDGSTGITARGIVGTGGTIRFYGGKITCTKASGSIGVDASGGAIELDNVRFSVVIGASAFDLRRTSGTLAINNIARDDGSALTTSGTITQLSRFALRDNNLSDLITPATARINLGLVIGTNVQAWDADLDTWATITPAAGIGTFLATPSSANLLAAVTDETGTGKLTFATLPNLITGFTIAGAAASGAVVIGDGAKFSGITTPTLVDRLTLAAGSLTVVPVVFQSGTNLTTPVIGAMEFDGVQQYETIDVTSGRGAIPVEQYFHLTAVGGAITTIANFFGANSNISLVASAYYVIEIYCWFLKDASAGTVTWTFTNSAAPTGQDIIWDASNVAGITATLANCPTGHVYNDATAARTLSTLTLTASVNHFAHFRIMLKNGTGTSLKIQATVGTGNITPGIGSWWRCRRLSPNNIGTFAA